MKTILCVEDELDVLKNNRMRLEHAGFSVRCAENIAQAREHIANGKLDAIVLDIMLPDGNGLDLLKELRDEGSKIPIIMLTAWGKPSDVARGLDLGANDYLSKPFEYDELLSRINAMFRNVEQIPDAINYDRLTLKPRSMEVHFGKQKVKLAPVEFFLLQLLMENEGNDLDSKTLYERVWGTGMNEDPIAVRNTVTRLRGKIAGSGYVISTVYNKGYRLEREAKAKV